MVLEILTMPADSHTDKPIQLQYLLPPGEKHCRQIYNADIVFLNKNKLFSSNQT